MATRRKKIPKAIRLAVLAEAGYRCAVPTCGTILAIDLHHLAWVSEGGPGDATNLLALCPTCHALHHRGEIPREALSLWKANLQARAMPNARVVLPSKKRESLRILYFHAESRANGFGYLHAPRLVEELERRGHSLRYCWAVHGPLTSDSAGVGRDLLDPQDVIDWKPDALVFEDGVFIGVPKIAPELLDDIEKQGAVAIIEIPPYEYHRHREDYDAFLRPRGIEVETSETAEPPSCKSFHQSYLISEVEVLRRLSFIKDDDIYEGVSSVVAASALPVKAWGGHLLVGGDHVHVKAYGNRRIHMDSHPLYGVFVDRDWRTEALFLAHVLFESPECPDNPIYFANLLEWMHSRRATSLLRGVTTSDKMSAKSTFRERI